MKPPSKSFRNSTSSQATLRLDGGVTLTCLVKDLSAGGAKLQIPATDVVPPRFHLDVGDLDVSAEATTVWRQGDLMGVRFAARQSAAANRAGLQRPAAPQQGISLADITAPRRFA